MRFEPGTVVNIGKRWKYTSVLHSEHDSRFVMVSPFVTGIYLGEYMDRGQVCEIALFPDGKLRFAFGVLEEVRKPRKTKNDRG